MFFKTLTKSSGSLVNAAKGTENAFPAVNASVECGQVEDAAIIAKNDERLIAAQCKLKVSRFDKLPIIPRDYPAK